MSERMAHSYDWVSNEVRVPKATLILKATSESIYLNQEVVIGRSDCEEGPVDIDLSGHPNGEYISRRHARIYFDIQKNCWKIKDLASHNGTYVKRARESEFSPRLNKPLQLAERDEIALGNLIMLFHL